jgi:hypothetical protein
MKTTLFFIAILVMTFTLSCSHQKANQKANKKPLHHAPTQDQYWNEMASESMDETLLATLEENYPTLSTQIKKDATDPYLPMFWGESLNFDSGAKKKIVEDKIIEELQSFFNIKNDNMIVHAGIMHTYGYLFSVIDTPYGYKRKRWIAPTLNTAFRFNSKALSPETTEGGLLSNVTYFCGMLAFTNKTDLSLLKNVANEVFTYDYGKLKYDRVEEVLKDYTIITTLVHFPLKRPGEDNEYLLIYSIDNKKLNKELLITAFPVNADSYNKIVAPQGLGPNQKIQLRYNGYLAGLGQNLTGTRKLTKH